MSEREGQVMPPQAAAALRRGSEKSGPRELRGGLCLCVSGSLTFASFEIDEIGLWKDAPSIPAQSSPLKKTRAVSGRMLPPSQRPAPEEPPPAAPGKEHRAPCEYAKTVKRFPGSCV